LILTGILRLLATLLRRIHQIPGTGCSGGPRNPSDRFFNRGANMFQMPATVAVLLGCVLSAATCPSTGQVLSADGKKSWQETKLKKFQGRMILIPSWADEKTGAKSANSLADDFKQLTRGKREWLGPPVKIKRELTGKVEQITPALSFFLIEKDERPEDEHLVVIGTDDNGIIFGKLTAFRLVEKESKRFIVLNEGGKKAYWSYTLKGGKMKIAADKKVKLLGEGEIDFSGDWIRKD